VKLLVEAANGALGVAHGRIVPPAGAFDVVLRVPDGEIRPGLINAHDHLHRNHYGRLGHPPYANAYEWGRDIHARDACTITRGRCVPRRAALLHGAWKNLLAGVTTVVHHDAWEPDFAADFPLRVARVRTAHSLGFEPALARSTGSGPFAVHLAEGVDAGAADEVRELERRGLLGGELLAVHVVGADTDGVRRLRASGTGVVWCPTSNEFLFGCTLPHALVEPGIDVLIGSDSLLTGAGSLLDELRRARTIGFLSDARLEDAVGEVAARRIGLTAPSLAPGARADVIVLRRPLLEASEADVALVIAAGTLRVLDETLVSSLGASADEGRLVRVRGVTRRVWDQRPRSPRDLPPAARQDTAPVSSLRSLPW
jgi:hypothetical protein